MLSNQVLLKTISDIKGITGAEISVWNLDGTCVLATNEIEERQRELVENFLFVEAEEMDNEYISQECFLGMVSVEESPRYLLMIEGLIGEPDVLGGLCVNQLENLITAYKEPLNKDVFLAQLLKGNLSGDEVRQKSGRVHIKNDVKRICYVIEPKEEQTIVKQTLKSLYTTGVKDFVVEMDKTHIAFVREISGTETEKDLHHVAETISDTISAEAMLYVRVSYGTVVNDLEHLKQSYEEARIALEVGRSFYAKRMVLAYKKLGIGRLIHQLPVSLCKEFMQEVLEGKGLEQFDDETMTTAYEFFRNNLNISETARQLYVHRNTLMNRLEKIQKKTGLDIRNFSDAMIFKLAIMVSNHVYLQEKMRNN